MRIELTQFINIGRARYAPGVYDTADGIMPHDIAAHLVNTEQAVLLADVLTTQEKPGAPLTRTPKSKGGKA